MENGQNALKQTAVFKAKGDSYRLQQSDKKSSFIYSRTSYPECQAANLLTLVAFSATNMKHIRTSFFPYKCTNTRLALLRLDIFESPYAISF